MMKKVKISNLEIGNGTPKIMGILNVSPESFYKESISIGKKIISERALQMENEGADIIDIGGMSTAPYLDTVISVEKEVERIAKFGKGCEGGLQDSSFGGYTSSRRREGLR